MPLTQAEQDRIKTLIERRHQALTEELRRDVQRARDENFAAVAGEVRDAADEATASLVTDTGDAETRRDLRELQALDAALVRLSRGEYGVCIACGEDIPIERLHAQPEAVRCLPCQDNYERTHARPGEPQR